MRIEIPISPTAKGLIVGPALVDGTVGTSADEYGLGPAGVALDGVPLFNPLAAPGDDIEDEKYTFDSYNAHPAQRGDYHYHTVSPGPLEVLKAKSLITTTTPGAAEIELYGITCDGTGVLGCTELDLSVPEGASLDGQGGHVHDMKDRNGTVMLAGRYHTHVCPGSFAHAYTPEIQYYTTCN